MQITYRRTGGIVVLVVFAVVAIATTVIAAVLAMTALAVLLGLGAAALVVRALLPRSWRRRSVPDAAPAPPWTGDTIEGTVVREIEEPR